MKLLIIITLSSLILFSCSGKNVKESSDDIASISDEELISDDPLMGNSSGFDSRTNDSEIASLEDDFLIKDANLPTMPAQKTTDSNNDVSMDEELIAADPINNSQTRTNTISMDDELVPSGINDTPSNQSVSGLMVMDNETKTWIPANKCVHIIKNETYTEPTCLKRR